MRKLVVFISLFFSLTALQAYQPEISIAGFFPLEGSGRSVYNFNPGWRFYRGDVQTAEKPDFDDQDWPVVNLPHSVQLMPAEGSGGRNYQGKAWYRKRFVPDSSLQGQQISLYFEAVMGRSTVYLNGKRVLEHLGGYLPFAVNLNEYGVNAGDTCLIAVCADNSDDKSYPPGKTQYTLDFAYHGGIYRDVWMIAKAPVHITDPVVESQQAGGGGVFVHYDNISEKSARVFVDTEIANKDGQKRAVVLETAVYDAEGKLVKKVRNSLRLESGEKKSIKQLIEVKQPNLWSPASPYLYRVHSQLRQGKTMLDGGINRVGIRLAEFKGKEGFWLNGKPYGQLIGTNRHQDFAYVGNAMPNSQHWRDAKKLREAGCEIIRAAHYPQDPAFMDACDELGIFMIVATPGWQYWNRDPQFQEYVLNDVTQMIRRDRNHPSVILWEPILNETRFPLDFSMKALEITKNEFPYPGAPLAVADMHSEGVAQHYGVVYGWPQDEGEAAQCIFTREFGENVDDWYAQNNNNRASRSWGELPQLVQALSLADSYDEMFQTSGQFIGGAQWHSFDHQRGYHPDPYWGGQTDCFRQPKYAYYMFKSQVSPQLEHPLIETGPMVYIAHEISPFSNADLVVFSNCDSVRLICREQDTIVKAVLHQEQGMPNAPVVFENVFDFWQMRELSYLQKNWQQVSFVAEGIIDGQTVCSTKKMPSRRSTKLSLRIDHDGQDLVADGSDFLVVVAEVTDDNGNVRRLAKENILFSVEGEGEIIGDASIGANPRAVEFGSAPVLIRSTKQAGKIKVKARVLFEGQHAPTPAEIEFESIPASMPFNHLESYQSVNEQDYWFDTESGRRKLSDKEIKTLLKEVEQQQKDFGVEK